MKKQNTYMCKNGHLHKCSEPPEKCKYCGEKDFGLIVGDTEDEDELSKES